MAKLTLKDLDIANKRVLVRVDFNVPLDKELNVTDPMRIKAALPTIHTILDRGGAVILMSHLGRPKGKRDPNFSLAPCQKVLESFLKKPVRLILNPESAEASATCKSLKNGEIALLENLRFYDGEEHPDKDPSFAKKLAALGDVFINDAFGTAHRKHSSTYSIAKYFPNNAAVGLLLEKEIHYLGEALSHPKHPFIALIGGAKVSTKMGILQTLIEKVDTLLIGGAMAFTFLKAQGICVGNSLVEEDYLPLAKKLLCLNKIVLPIDVVCAQEISEKAPSTLVSLKEGIPDSYLGLDIGPQTLNQFKKIITQSKTLVWNGPFGVYEIAQFAKGTEALAQFVAHSEAISVLGGGDLLAAVSKMGISSQITHLSTGGGASLEYLEKGTLPAIEVLSDKK